MESNLRVADISLIITAHREGGLSHPTLRSVTAMLDSAKAASIAVELVVVLDRPDDETRARFQRFASQVDTAIVEMIEVDEGDLGSSRMRGVAVSSAPFISWIDADNLYSPGWLKRATKMLQDCPSDVVIHPAWILSFGEQNQRFAVKASTSPDFDLGVVPAFHPWTSMAATSRAVIESHSFTRSAEDQGFGPEDWHWNLETLAAGVDHLVAPETAVFCRIKRDGTLWPSQAKRGVVLRPTALLSDPEIARRQAIRIAPFYDQPELGKLAKVAQRYPALTLPIRAATRPLRKTKLIPQELPDGFEAWLEEDVSLAATHEPRIPSVSEYLEVGPPWQAVFDEYYSTYWQAVDSFGKGVDRLFIVSEFFDEDELAYLNNYASNHRDLQLAVWSESPSVELLTQLDSRIRVASATIDMEPREGGARSGERLLASLVVQLAPRSLEVLHSAIGHRTLAMFGSAMAVHTELNLRLRSIRRDAHGAPESWYFDFPVTRSVLHEVSVPAWEDAHLISLITGEAESAFRIR